MLARFVEQCIRHRVPVVSLFAALTAVMLVLASQVEVKTIFDEQLPKNHPYIQANERIKETFGGSNVVSIVLEVSDGDIFRDDVLSKIRKVTNDLQQVPGVNQFQIISLASKKLKEVRGSTEDIEFRPIMWPDVPKTADELAQLRESVLTNPMVLGAFVSNDLKAALISVDFYDNALDYKKIFTEITSIVESVKSDDIKVRVVGEPILYGWVDHYVPETLKIFMLTVVCMIVLLFGIARTWRGTLLPLLAGVSSAIWALGFARILGFNLDPLVIVVAFLITARAISHSVQLVTRFEDELNAGVVSSIAAAKTSMLALFKPGMLGVIADAGCMIVVFLTPIPLLQKISLIGTSWVLTIALTACVMTPVLLSWVKLPRRYAHRFDVASVLDRVLSLCIRIVTTRMRYVVLVFAAILFAGSGFYAFNLTVGDAEPGSPILWQDSTYNRDAVAINSRFQGADRMLVVFGGNKPDAIKDPAVLDNIRDLQRYMGSQPEVGGSLSIADVVPAVKSVMREGNPRYQEFGDSARENGELMYLFVSGSDPGDIKRFADPKYQDAAVEINFRDHTGETIRTAIARVKEFVERNPVAEGEYILAGGLIGVLAAVNEVILAGQIEAIALALLVLVLCCAVAYRSTVAGMFFMVPVILSNTVTFSYMAWEGIGMSISTLPVVALGIGLGVDYAFYIVDGIREELHHHDDVSKAIIRSLRTAGRGVLVTALTLTASVALWWTSSLRFQAEMGILMGIWLFVSAASALFLMPAMVYVFRPDFVVGASQRRVHVAGPGRPCAAEA
ncbi:MMPL family transporter [Aromatoleum toluclasticum]|uniref:efflux RND transporter permease subunit n=1 Tax=Aromatoleum toluclasticum TaxID=92003 RepID=UPI001D192144|nr:MMPL family transporter [Aromatoleum toluclasticum]MCC4118480.1 MMPL family transporter [Aromatoleum toluclasticum]